jgi:hypothetical protein
MRHGSYGAHLIVLGLGLAGLPTLSAAAEAPKVDSARFAHCAAMTAADERLACYDSLAMRRSVAPPAPAAPQAAGSADGGAASPPHAPIATPAVAAAQPQSFGLSEHKVAPAGPDSIHAIVTQVTENAQGNVSVRLDNGQSWSLNEPGASLKQGDAVAIKHASLGSFLLVAPDRRSYRARRLQ